MIFLTGVGILAVFKRLLKYDCLILVKQYRPALKQYTLELPAGILTLILCTLHYSDSINNINENEYFFYNVFRVYLFFLVNEN